MDLDTFIASLQALPKAEDPQKALQECRKVMIEKTEGAQTESEMAKAYLYYKAFYELQPWPAPGEPSIWNTEGDNAKKAGFNPMREPYYRGFLRTMNKKND